MACWRTWALVNWHMTPYSLQKHLSAEYTMCTEATLSIDAARHLLFSKTGEPEAMAPTSDALRFHLRRVHYQSMIWRNAHCSTPELPAPSEIGRRLVDSELLPVLMTLSPIPDSCLEMVAYVHVVNSARLVAANARSQECDAHQCVHASIRRMISRLAWIGNHEDWLRCMKAVHAGVPTPGKSPKLRFGSHFVYAN